jgi:hypothetical protein
MINWIGCGKKRSWPNLRHCYGIFLEGLRKTTKVRFLYRQQMNVRVMYLAASDQAACRTTSLKTQSVRSAWFTFLSASLIRLANFSLSKQTNREGDFTALVVCYARHRLLSKAPRPSSVDDCNALSPVAASTFFHVSLFSSFVSLAPSWSSF